MNGSDGSSRGGAAPAQPAKGPKTASATLQADTSSADMVVRYNSATPPVLSFAAAKLAHITVHFKAHAEKGVVLHLPLGSGTLVGDKTVARYFSRLAEGERATPYSTHFLPPAATSTAIADAALRAARIDHWLDHAAEYEGADWGKLQELDAFFAMRSFVEPPCLSIADAALFAVVAKNAAWTGAKPADAKRLQHLSRWYSHVLAVPAFATLLSTYLGGPRTGGGSFDINLPGAEEGKVCTRFPPEPSGFLHIGHAKAALLNEYFATEYKGKILLRFDDTNPSKEKGEYTEAIIEDVARMGIKPFSVTHTSDYFDALIKVQTDMIERRVAYVDPRPAKEQQDDRLNKRPSPYREASTEDNLRLWKEMQLGTEEGLMCCVRAKIDPESDNGTLRDPTTYRCNLDPHPLKGTAYKVYPTYDLACPYVDAIEGVTHALRDRQYIDRDVQYQRMCELMQVRQVALWSFSRINFKKCLLSKRKLQWFVETGRVEGWDDPRMPTIQGILRRGLTVAGLRTFILLQVRPRPRLSPGHRRSRAQHCTGPPMCTYRVHRRLSTSWSGTSCGARIARSSTPMRCAIPLLRRPTWSRSTSRPARTRRSFRALRPTCVLFLATRRTWSWATSALVCAPYPARAPR